jgi:hypothetical protein
LIDPHRLINPRDVPEEAKTNRDAPVSPVASKAHSALMIDALKIQVDRDR